eukprot:TRINITY_DN10033_c0_g1_i2.p1 TRINITY_DN10033_c0_g1~~TRINITY_DN10033_c0_g1_i2.p1  ORF type:complete len:296 (-),score=36.84 TRINITY_DN10033_c0_g1_i2:11-898(-)
MSAGSGNYLAYDFERDPNWGNFLNDCDPEKIENSLEEIKRNYYKKFVDPSFEVGSIPNALPTQGLLEGKESASKEKEAREAAEKEFRKKIQTVKSYIRIYFFIGIFFKLGYRNWIALAISVLTVLEKCGIPDLSLRYVGKVLQMDFLRSNWYLIPFLNIEKILYYLPIFVHLGLAAAELFDYRIPTEFKEVPEVHKAMQHTQKYKKMVSREKLKMLGYVALSFLVTAYYGQGIIGLIILYGILPSFKVSITKTSEKLLDETDGWIKRLLKNPNCPQIVHRVYHKLNSVDDDPKDK